MKIKLYCLPALLITVLFQTACNKQGSLDQNEASSQLVPLFRALYVAEYGKFYPHSEKILERCKTTDDKKCLALYKSVNNAKQELISLKSQETLKTTFKIIIDSCESPNEEVANFDCYGALMSFYFYSEAEYDADILEFVKNLSPRVQTKIFNGNFDWFINRPDPELWVDYLKDAPVEWQTDAAQQVTMDYFINKFEPAFWTKD
jgi:hypothetical protein